MSNEQNMGVYDRTARSIELMDERMTKAGNRVGLNPYPTDY